ncbi:hypothetical protein M7I_3495 [Glarea lozoyensis 74030]|uniref:Uncharacterized protein n=1 Tax=Glarea lozoyensis (strain ATCC 74030 / MF5533) TaxID=1104152 RepID=H0ELM8_GLAL7|nr:hypothetical protein M7I_3495 [Glarea lozoyensis 74030]
MDTTRHRPITHGTILRIKDINAFLHYLANPTPTLKQTSYIPQGTYTISDVAINGTRRIGRFRWSQVRSTEVIMHIAIGKDGIGFGFCGVTLDHDIIALKSAMWRRKLTEEEKKSAHRAWEIPTMAVYGTTDPKEGQWEWEPIVLPAHGRISYHIDRYEHDPRGTCVDIKGLRKEALC